MEAILEELLLLEIQIGLADAAQELLIIIREVLFNVKARNTPNSNRDTGAPKDKDLKILDSGMASSDLHQAVGVCSIKRSTMKSEMKGKRSITHLEMQIKETLHSSRKGCSDFKTIRDKSSAGRLASSRNTTTRV